MCGGWRRLVCFVISSSHLAIGFLISIFFCFTVRLDLEFSFHNARKFLRSTILDIRPQTPPPPPPPASGSVTQASRTDDPSQGSSAPGLGSDQNSASRNQAQQAQVQELWSIIAYLSRINTRLMSAVGRSNTAQGSSSSPSFGGQSQGRRQSVWGVRSRGGTTVEEAPPPYQV